MLLDLISCFLYLGIGPFFIGVGFCQPARATTPIEELPFQVKTDIPFFQCERVERVQLILPSICTDLATLSLKVQGRQES